MSAEYQVQYHIEVFSTPAIEAINSFKSALASLTKASKPLVDLQRQVRSVNDTLAGLKKQQIQLNTVQAKEQLTELLTLARELKATLAGTNMGAVKGARAARNTGGSQTSPSVGQTGHMPLAPRSAGSQSGWVHPGHPSYPMYRMYQAGMLDQNDARRIEGQVRRANKARFRAAQAETDAYQAQLKTYRDADVQRRWDARKAARSAEAQARQQRRLDYLRNNRDAIYARHGITADLRYAPIGLGPDGKYVPAYSANSKWRPQGATNAYGGRRYSPRQFWQAQPKNLSYKLLGPTPLPNNGGIAIDMLKGMGIAYGIAGLGSLFSNIVTQSAEYDNTMKTVENILKSHDQQSNFNGRFSAMSNTVRQVGMETKYTVTEVADAAKFLAMAGLNTEAINKSIRPIADIALVGDTNLGETADLVTNIMTAYNISPDKMRNAADVMTNTFTMSNTTLTEIAEAYKYSAALLSAGGIDFEESTAAIGVLGDAGIKGSQAGTTMRTLLANILNPTKKQAGAWSEVGISTKGKTLVQIFQELHDKNISVSQFYRLFHKTAAQGAIALADHVQKWNEVIVENFMSDGLSSRLADEKKNTLSGLWAQLTSVFTDDGVKAFGGIQGGIRSILKSTIEWLKTDNAQQQINKLFKTFAEFGKIVIDITKKFYGLYKICQPFIMSWIKFQFIIWPVVKGLTALKSIVLSLQAIKGLAVGINSVTSSLWRLNSAAAATSSITSAGGKSIYGGPVSFLPGVTHAQRIKAARGLELRRPHLMYADKGSPLEAEAAAWNQAAIQQYRNDHKKYNRRLAWAQTKNGLKSIGGSLAGGALMGYGIHTATQEDATSADLWAGGLYSAAGVAAMVGGPWGWGAAAVLGIAGVIAQIAGHYERMQKIVNGFAEFANSHKIINGIFVNSSDKTMQYLEGIYDRNDDINNLIKRRIDLTKELLGLQNADSNDFNSSGIYDQTRKELWDLGWGDRWKSADFILSQWGSQSRITQDNGIPVYNLPDGTTIKYRNPYGNIDKAFSNDLATAKELMNGGYYSGLVSDVRNQVMRRLLLGTSKDDWNSFWNNYYLENDPSKIEGLIRPNEFNETKFQLEHWDQDRKLKSYFARNEVYNNLELIAAPMRDAINQYLLEKELGHFNESTIIGLLRNAYSNIDSRYWVDYDSRNIGNWFRNFGFWDGTFHEFLGNDADIMAQTSLKVAGDIQTALRQLSLEGDPAAESLMTFTNTLIAQAQAFLGKGEEIVGEFDGQIKDYGNLTLQWDAEKQVWNQIVNDNTVYISTLSSNINWLNSSIYGLGSTVGGYDWNSMWSNMLPRFGTTSFSGWSLGGSLNYGGSTLTPSIPTFEPYIVSLGVGGFEGLSSGALLTPKLGFSLGFQSPMNNLGHNWGVGGLQSNVSTSYFTPAQVGNMVHYRFGSGGNAGNDGNGSDLNDDSSGNDAYKSNYRNNSAAPKQVIVNIENLMNVDKVDLSNPNNAAVIDDLKSQLTQALVDVVHDFDETWHG